MGGVLAISLPILTYFFANNAIADLFQVYFFDNIFLYTNHGNLNPILRSIIFCFNGFVSAYKKNLLIFILLVLSAIAILKAKIFSFIKIHIFVCYAFSLFFIFYGGQRHAYYTLTLSVFCIFSSLLFPLVKMNSKLKMISSAIFSVLVIFTFSANVNLLGLKKSDYPQFEFAKTISKKENATLLNYGFLDGGFYTTTKIVPTCKYFCRINMPNSEMIEEQNKFIKEALIDFVVTKNEKLESENYELLQSVRSEIRKSDGEFFLYKKRSDLLTQSKEKPEKK